MSDIRLDELVSCKICDAVITRSGRPAHLGWHARLNARMQNLQTELVDHRVLLERLEQQLVQLDHQLMQHERGID